MLRLFPLVLFFLSYSVQSSTDGTILGRVVDEHERPVQDAVIEMRTPGNSTFQTLKTTESGTFDIPLVPFGDYKLSAEKEGMTPQVLDVHVDSGNTSVVPLKMMPFVEKEMILEVRAKRRSIQNLSAESSVQIGRETIANLPQGDQVKLPELIANTTPGVVQGAFGQLFFRGNHANIQYQIDGVQMPDSPSSTFGEAFSPRNIEHMEIITGGIPAEYGQRLGAVVNIITKSGAESAGGALELNYGTFNKFSPQLVYGGSNKAGDLHYYFSANYNQTDRGMDTPEPVSATNPSQGAPNPTHDFANGNNQFLKIDYLLDNSNKLTFTFFNNYSFYQIPNFSSAFPPTSEYFQSNPNDPYGNTSGFPYRASGTNDTQAEWNEYLQAVWKHSFSPTSFIQVAPYWKYSNLRVNNDLSNDLNNYEVVGSHSGTSFDLRRHTNNLGLKTDFTTRAGEHHLFKAGIQLQASQALGTVQVITPSVNSVNSDPNFGAFEDAYVQDEITLTDELSLNAGLRFSATQFRFSGANPNDSMLQPRIGLSYLASQTTKLHAYYGRLFQPSALENLRVTYSNLGDHAGELLPYDIQAEKASFYEAGVSQQFADSQTASVNVYYKNGINILDDEQIPNTSIAQPFNFAEGYTYGVELSLRGNINSEWSNYVNYSYVVGKGKGISGGIFAFQEDHDHDDDHDHDHGHGGHTHDVSGNSYQILDHIQKHTVNSGLTYSKNQVWATVQGLFGSGLRTGSDNSSTLPSHFTMDATVGYKFPVWRMSLDILNMWNNRYPITIANGYSGTHYAAGREFFFHLTRDF